MAPSARTNLPTTPNPTPTSPGITAGDMPTPRSMKRRQTPTDITAATERRRELPRAEAENGRPDRDTTRDRQIAGQGRVEVRLPSNSPDDSHRDDGGSDCSS